MKTYQRFFYIVLGVLIISSLHVLSVDRIAEAQVGGVNFLRPVGKVLLPISTTSFDTFGIDVLNCTEALETSASGTIVCGTDATGGAGGGSVSTSSPITANHFPYWANVGGGLAGTSTLVNVNGVIEIRGLASSTELRVGSSTLSVGGGLTTVRGNLQLLADNSVYFGDTQSTAIFYDTSANLLNFTGQETTTSTIAFLTGNNASLINMYGIASSTELISPSSTLSVVRFTSASGTNITVTGYGTIPTLNFTNASGSRATLSTSVDSPTGAFTNISSTNINAVTRVTSARGELTNVSATQMTASTGIQGGRLNVTAASTTDITASGHVVINGFTRTASSSVASGNLMVGTTTASNQLFTVVNSANVTALSVSASTTQDFVLAAVTSTATEPFNASNLFFGVASSGMTYLAGTSTVSLGGAALLAGACTSTNVIFPLGTGVPFATSTDMVVSTPQVDPGDSAYWKAIIMASSTVKALVCEPVAATPTASVYNVSVWRIIGK